MPLHAVLWERRPMASPAGLSCRYPSATAHFMTAPIRWRTLLAVSRLVLQIGSRTAITSAVVMSETPTPAQSRHRVVPQTGLPLFLRLAAVLPGGSVDGDDRLNGVRECRYVLPRAQYRRITAGSRQLPVIEGGLARLGQRHIGIPAQAEIAPFTTHGAAPYPLLAPTRQKLVESGRVDRGTSQTGRWYEQTRRSVSVSCKSPFMSHTQGDYPKPNETSRN